MTDKTRVRFIFWDDNEIDEIKEIAVRDMYRSDGRTFTAEFTRLIERMIAHSAVQGQNTVHVKTI